MRILPALFVKKTLVPKQTNKDATLSALARLSGAEISVLLWLARLPQLELARVLFVAHGAFCETCAVFVFGISERRRTSAWGAIAKRPGDGDGGYHGPCAVGRKLLEGCDDRRPEGDTS